MLMNGLLYNLATFSGVAADFTLNIGVGLQDKC